MLLPTTRAWGRLPYPGARIAQSFLDRAILVVDGADVRHNRAFGSAPDGYQLVGTRYVGVGGPGYVGSSGSYLTARTTAWNPDELLQIAAGSDWTMQFVVENVGVASGTNPGWFRNGASALQSTFVVTNGSTRRPWLRVNGVEILKPTTGPQWVDGTTVNLIIRFRSGVSADFWFGGQKQYSTTHSTATPVLSGNTYGIWSLLTNSGNENLRGNLVAYRAWSRHLSDKETNALARNQWALYDPVQTFYPLPDGSALMAAIAEALGLSDGLTGSVQAISALTESMSLSEALTGSAQTSAALAESLSLGELLTRSAQLSAAQTESAALADSQVLPALPPILLPGRRRQLSQPAGRLVTAPWYARSGSRDWTYSGTLANATRQHNSTEGPHTVFLSSVCQLHIMADPIGWDNTLNFTILSRLRIDFASATSVLFAFGNTTNNLQHFLQLSTFDSSLYFTVAGWNGTSNTSITSAATPAVTTGRFYNIAITSRYQLVEIWMDGVKVVSTSHALTFAAQAMTHAVLHGAMSSGSPSSSAASVSYVALVAFPGQVLSNPELASITADPRGIHKLFEQDARLQLLSARVPVTLNDGVSDAVVLSETQTSARSTAGSAAESVAMSDSQVGLQTAVAVAGESLGLADGQTVLATLVATRSEALGLTDAQAAVQTALGTMGETVSLSDLMSSDALGTVSATQAEAMALVAGQTTIATLGVTQAESAALVDGQGTTATLGVVQAESVVLADAATVLFTRLVSVLESMDLVDDASSITNTTVITSLSEALEVADACDGVVVALGFTGGEVMYLVMDTVTISFPAGDPEIRIARA